MSEQEKQQLRQLYAGLAMQAVITSGRDYYFDGERCANTSMIVKVAIEFADELLLQLSKVEDGGKQEQK